MAVPSLRTLHTTVGEMVQTFRWDLDLSALQDLDWIAGGLAEKPNLSKLVYMVETMDLPKKTMQQSEVILRGTKVKQAAFPDFGNNLAINFIETVSMDVTNMMNAWSNICSQSGEDSVGDETEDSIGSWLSSMSPTLDADGYKRDLVMYRLNGRKQRIYGIKLLGCYYEDQDQGGQFDSGTDFAKPALTISFDAFVPIKV